MKMTPDKNASLVTLIKLGDLSAFEKFYNTYKKPVFLFIVGKIHSRDDAEDILQNVFINFWESRGNLKEELSSEAYIFQIARNLIFNFIRKKMNREVYDRHLELNQNLILHTTTDDVLFTELENNYNMLIDKLPGKRKMIFIYAKHDGLSYKEIAEKMDISVNTVDSHLKKAVNHIRTELLRIYRQ